jgi:alpha-1,3-glucosyltransferase
LALGFKQIALYYALCFFFYMLGWALFNGKSLGIKVLRLGLLGLSVIGTFALLFGPFLRAQPEGWQSLTQIQQILHRVFPFDRGLYEDKVANFWCVTNLLIKWRTIFSQDQLKLLTTVLTFGCGTLASSTLLSAQRRKHLFWEVLSVVSLSFFLFGYQVHEKSILYPLLPIVFLYPRYPTVTVTFGLLATLSMFPLLERDGLGQVYAVAQIAYVFLAWLLSQEWKTTSRVFFSLCVLAVVGTHICASTIPHMAPVVVGKYPDIGTYLYVLCSGLYFHVIWVYLCLQVFLQVVSGKKKQNQKQKQKQKHKRKKKKK